MFFQEKSIVLRDGKIAVLRSPRVGDAEALLDYLKTTAAETEFVLKYPEECTMTLEAEERFIQNILDSPLNMMIVCEADGKIAGNCHLSMNSRIKTRHRGTVAIALYREFWGRGIGTAMFREMIAIGKEQGLAQLELEFIEGNERGQALYEKMGFEIVAEKPDAIRLKDGTMLKEFFMIRKLIREE